MSLLCETFTNPKQNVRFRFKRFSQDFFSAQVMISLTKIMARAIRRDDSVHRIVLVRTLGQHGSISRCFTEWTRRERHFHNAPN
jgi:hypothetical protein